MATYTVVVRFLKEHDSIQTNTALKFAELQMCCVVKNKRHTLKPA